MGSDVVLVIVVGTALAFDFTNGFHDTANVVATSISTGAARPQVAIGIAALLNFAGAFISISVAATVAKDVVDAGAITPTVVFAGLIGAIAWNLITWWFGLPSSSSHALIGGVVGSAVAAVGFDAVLADGLVGKVLIPAIVAPLLAFAVAGIAIGVIYRIVGRQRPGTVTRGFRYGQLVSGGLLALAHGTNDAQKTMGVITLTLISVGLQPVGSGPEFWVIVVCAIAIALGTYMGGWRIIKTLGTGLTDVKPAQGFASETSTAATILASTHLGFALSTTQVASGSVIGSGMGRRGSKVRWRTAGRIGVGWLLTLPAAGAVGAIAALVAHLGAVGIIIDTIAGVVVIAGIFLWSRRSEVSHVNVVSEVAESGQAVKIKRNPKPKKQVTR
jgi:inorganic phosphate transporter, PiT family